MASIQLREEGVVPDPEQAEEFPHVGRPATHQQPRQDPGQESTAGAGEVDVAQKTRTKRATGKWDEEGSKIEEHASRSKPIPGNSHTRQHSMHTRWLRPTQNKERSTPLTSGAEPSRSNRPNRTHRTRPEVVKVEQGIGGSEECFVGEPCTPLSRPPPGRWPPMHTPLSPAPGQTSSQQQAQQQKPCRPAPLQRQRPAAGTPAPGMRDMAHLL